MEFHVGRLLDHVHVRVANLEVSKRFYHAVLKALGRQLTFEGDHYFASDELFVSSDGTPSQVHLAFQADGSEAVRRFYDAGLAAGGRDNGAPAEQPYHPGYYSAYLLDPDGNNIEAVWHGPARRSAEAVVITAGA